MLVESCKVAFKNSVGSLQRSRARATVLMKMKRPAAREITPLKSDCSGQGDWICRFEATLLNRSWAKVRKSEGASSSAARSYRKYDDRAWAASKKRWMSTSA